MRTSRLYVQSVHVDVQSYDYAFIKASSFLQTWHRSFRLQVLYLPIRRAGMHRTMLYKLLRQSGTNINQSLQNWFSNVRCERDFLIERLRCSPLRFLRSIQYFVHLVKHRGECRQRIYILFGIRTSGYVQSR
jgi:hypothetical protein